MPRADNHTNYRYYLEIWELQPPGTIRDCPSLYRDCYKPTFVLSFVLGVCNQRRNTGEGCPIKYLGF
jgi:hypothetical protein